jgi:hypothetical protein
MEQVDRVGEPEREVLGHFIEEPLSNRVARNEGGSELAGFGSRILGGQASQRAVGVGGCGCTDAGIHGPA